MTKTAQVANAMRQLIVDEYWKLGQSVGDLFALQDQSEKLFGVRASWGTIRAAEQILVDEGLLSAVQPGVPTRVTAVPSRRTEAGTMADLRAIHATLGDLHTKLGKLIAAAS